MTQFFDTLSGKVKDFNLPPESEVKMYTCGPTVYDYAHIGNFRAFVFEDLLRRFLEFSGYKVQHVMNVTDVDDKTIAGANKESQEGEPKDRLNRFTEKYLQAFNEDLKTLNILPPTKQPRATQEIQVKRNFIQWLKKLLLIDTRPIDMIELIERLIKKGKAYVSEGSVYYRVSSFPDYGNLSKKNLDKNITGARVDADEYKQEGADFVLWKKKKEGEPFWNSPWGPGRPGWHIECSAMSMKYLGEQFDIHAGGEDLIFPHHENEIAQSEAATGKPFVKYWLHCKFLLVDGKKMSKKEKNFYTLRDLLTKGYDPMAIRYALLAVHYQQPLNFTLEGLEEAGEVIKRLDNSYAEVSLRDLNVQFDAGAFREEEKTKETLEVLRNDMLEALGEDLNVSKAIAIMLEGVKVVNTAATAGDLNNPANHEAAARFFQELDKIFGFGIATEKVPADIFQKMRERSDVRQQIIKQNDKSLWSVSDKLRDEIQSKGWLVKDGKPGEPSTVKKKRRAWDQ